MQDSYSSVRQHPSPPARRRAPAACVFCRRRKIKCNNQRPICGNCSTYGEECIFEPVNEPAPEVGRIRQMQEKRLKSLTRKKPAKKRAKRHADGSSRKLQHDGEERQGAVLVDEQGSRASPAENSDDSGGSVNGAMDGQKPDSRVSRILVSANGVSSYHGRTSALFEDNAPERHAAGKVRPRMPDDWVEKMLVSEASQQNQMEDINYRDGKLDFDGIDPDLGMHLLSLHWNRQHHSFLVTYRPAFMRDMACNGPYFSKLLLNAIYFGAAKFSPRLEVRREPEDVRTAGWRFRQRVSELLGSTLDRSDITTIQALLVMTNSLFALGDERNAAWLYSGLAFRMITDLGVHVDLSNMRRFSDEDLEIRRRVFWGAFVVDKIQSLYQGRPATLKESDALVPIKFLDVYEELQPWTPFAYPDSVSDYQRWPAYSTSTFASLCRLSLVMSDILSSIYTERSSAKDSTELAGVRTKLHVKLRDWEDALPPHLHIDATKLKNKQFPPPHVFSLHAIHHVLVILLHRPFVADGHLYDTSREISVESFMNCASAASSIVQLLRAYHTAFSIKRAPYLISYATYVAATIHTRIAARRSNDSTAHANLATCLAVFQENQATNSAVQKAKAIVEGLMKKLGVVIEDVSADALKMDKPPKSGAIIHTTPSEAVSSTSDERRQGSVSTSRPTNMEFQEHRNLAVISTQSPASDMMDVDGIIQTFRPEEYPTSRGPTAALPLPQQYQMPLWASHGNAATVCQSPSYPSDQLRNWAPGLGSTSDSHAMSSQAVAWQQYSGDHALLEDPLFGLNGPNSDPFQFMGW